MKSYTYAIGDLHGRFDLLAGALLHIGLHAAMTPARYKIVTCGDYVDRGPDSKKIIDFLMKRDDVIALKGNHEQMFLDLVEPSLTIPGINIEVADNEEVAPTLVSYGIDPEKPDFSLVPKAHLDFLRNLPYYHADDHRVFVHAWLDIDKTLDRQNGDDMTWGYFRKGYGDDGYQGKHIVHGHESFPMGPILRPGRTNIDTLAYHTGRLAIAVFDDAIPGGPIEILEEKGLPLKEILRNIEVA